MIIVKFINRKVRNCCLLAGHGECIYEVGVAEHSDDAGLTEDELSKAEATLHSLAKQCMAQATLLRRRQVSDGLHTSDWLVRQNVRRLAISENVLSTFVIFQTTPEDFIEVRVAVVGNVDAGKSTLLGVLTHGELDNGRGLARLKLFRLVAYEIIIVSRSAKLIYLNSCRHKHEVESGRTSSVGNDILGFDVSGHVVNKPNAHDGRLDWTELCADAAKVHYSYPYHQCRLRRTLITIFSILLKVVTFIDLAGHEKYLKTTIFGMTGHLPHYCMLMVGANAGVIGTTKEHLGLALALNVPVFVVITKVSVNCSSSSTCAERIITCRSTCAQRLSCTKRSASCKSC